MGSRGWHRAARLAGACALTLLSACGEEAPTPVDAGSRRDAGPPSVCASPAELSPCCRRISERDADAIELRMTGMVVNEPPVFASLNPVLQSAIQDLRVNVLFRITGALEGGAVVVQMGAGLPVDGVDSTRFVFFEGNALHGPADQWDSTQGAGVLEADGRLVTDPTEGVLQMPAISGEYPEECHLFAQLPLRAVRILDATLDHEGTCIGARVCRDLAEACSDGGARMEAYISIDDALGVCEAAIGGQLCSRLAGASCTDTPREEWPRPPDALCVDNDCRTGCDPVLECNAYEIRAEIVAGAVDIVPLAEVEADLEQPCMPRVTECNAPDADAGP